MGEEQASPSVAAHARPEPTTPTPSGTTGHPFPSSPLMPYHHESLQNQDHLQPQIVKKRFSQVGNESATEQPNLARSPRDIKRLIGPWNLGATLGTGATGRVRKARHIITGQVAAVKIMSKTEAASMRSTSVMQMDTRLAPGSYQADGNFLPFGLEREIVIMKLIDHPNIVRLYDLWENRGEIYLVLEHVDGGELFNYIVERGCVNERDAFRIFRQLMGAVHYCHMFRVCHRDIKPENILVDSIGNIKLADFGMASREHVGGLNTSCGSPHYAPPEIAYGDGYIGSQVDIWSCGVVLYVMLTGTLPFGAGLGMNDLETVLLEITSMEPDYSRNISDLAYDLLVRMFRKNPSSRITAEDLWRHPLMTYYEKVGKTAPDRHRWIGGPPPALTTADCGPPMVRAEIDRDLLSGLCIFWHVVDPEEMMSKLMENRPNYEKVIYKNLFNFRKEQEENYSGANLEHTESDVHHVQRRPIRTQSRMTIMSEHGRVPSVRSIRQQLLPPGYRMSGISTSSSSNRGDILGAKRPHIEEHHHSAVPLSGSRFTIVEPPARPITSQTSTGQSSNSSRHPSQKSQTTEKSYDPFRASSTAKRSAEADHAKVTVLGDASQGSRYGYANYAASLRRPATEHLRSGKISMQSSPQSFVREIQAKNRSVRRSNTHRLHSTSSWASTGMSTSSVRQFSVPVVRSRRVIRISTTKRREPPPPRPRNPTPLSRKQGFVDDLAKNRVLNSPTQSIVTRRQALPSIAEEDGNRALSIEPSDNSKRTSILWEERTRQASVELSELMDEVFSDEQLDSALWEEATEQQKQDEFVRRSFDLPGLRETGYSRHTPEVNTRKPEAPPPSKNPVRLKSIYDADSAAELIKVKQSLELRARDLGISSLDPVIGHLNRLLSGQPPSASRRIASAPGPSRQYGKVRSLSPVPEEEEEDEPRHVSSPVKGKHSLLKGKKSTIRLVDDKNDSSLCPAPLKIKKKISLPWLGSSNAGASSSTLERFFKRNGSESHVTEGLQDMPSGANRNDSVLAENELGDNQGGKNWFRRSHASTNASLSIDDPDNNRENTRDERTRSDTNTTSDDLPFRLPKRESTTSKVVRFFTRQPKENRMQIALPGDDEADWYDSPSTKSNQSIQSTSGVGSRASVRLEHTPHIDTIASEQQRLSYFPQSASPHLFSPILTREPRFQQPTATNLFARLFNIPSRQTAPVPHLICLHLPRITAINEIKTILRGWQIYGLFNIRVNKQSGTIHATVADNNSFGILPVAIVAAVHAVAVNGNAGGLSIVKITAEWGNRSSFNQACESIERVLRARNLVLMEKHIVSEMKKALRNWERL